LNCAG
jgi:hypothetical protein